MLATIASAIGLFAATNIDDIVVLTVLFLASSRGKPRPWQIVAGQYLGFITLVVISVIAALGLTIVPDEWVGFLGLIVAVLATILPPIVIISVISMMYAAFAENEWVRAVLTGMQSGVAAVICDVTANLGGKVVQSKDWLNLLLMAGAFAASAVFHVNVIVVILVAAAIGVIRALLARKGGVSV